MKVLTGGTKEGLEFLGKPEDIQEKSWNIFKFLCLLNIYSNKNINKIQIWWKHFFY